MKFSKFNCNKFYCKFATILLIFGCVFHNTMQKPLEHSFISCLFSRMSPCGRNSLCKSDMRGIYPHPENNNQYVNCYGEKTYILSCGPGAVFDRLSKMCIRYVAAESKYY
ncbi:uncharacterized protein LOC123300737 [Chrysoperla carnea]|uniref:uncharacterized protein LOC123300737 n=1 Tax=Chrysoperla carnea TaxID=189513 RepID=UPI001D07C1FE|nr:uncharacterized protein LOC123300737 [Chrysoperla carnea]